MNGWVNQPFVWKMGWVNQPWPTLWCSAAACNFPFPDLVYSHLGGCRTITYHDPHPKMFVPLGGCLFGKVCVSFVWGMCLVHAFRVCLVEGWLKKTFWDGLVLKCDICKCRGMKTIQKRSCFGANWSQRQGQQQWVRQLPTRIETSMLSVLDMVFHFEYQKFGPSTTQ